MVFMTYLSHNPTFFLHWLFVSSSSSSRWHPCSRHIWRTRPSPGTRTYWWCSQLSCVLPGRWPSVFFLLAMHNQTSFGSALASFVSCRGSSGCGCYGQDTMSHWPKKICVTGWVTRILYSCLFIKLTSPPQSRRLLLLVTADLPVRRRSGLRLAEDRPEDQPAGTSGQRRPA